MRSQFLFLVLAVCVAKSAFASTEPSCELRFGEKRYRLEEKIDEKDYASLTEFLENFAVSKKTVAAFQAKLKNKSISALPFAERPEAPIPNAVALFDLDNAALYVANGELGVVAVNFFHEMVHANDMKYAESVAAWKKSRDDKARDKMIFQAERAGYDAQRALLLEIFKIAPDCAEEYFLFHESKQELVVRAVSDRDLIAHYRLNPDWVK